MAIPHNSYNGIVLPKLLRDLSYSLQGDCITKNGISRPARCWTEILSNVHRISTSSSSSGLPSKCTTVTWKSVKGPYVSESKVEALSLTKMCAFSINFVVWYRRIRIISLWATSAQKTGGWAYNTYFHGMR